jgi:hypothetical protein
MAHLDLLVLMCWPEARVARLLVRSGLVSVQQALGFRASRGAERLRHPDALMTWVESGQAPGEIVASRATALVKSPRAYAWEGAKFMTPDIAR